MAGHSKWANIKHRKGKADKAKGKAFSQIAKEIINSVKLHGADPKANPRLRLALQKARSINFPGDNIDRCIKKASEPNQEAYHEMQYELYGHGGVGIIVDIMTDNKNRIASDIRIATNKRGGTIAHPGAVSFNFDRKGVIHISRSHGIEDELFTKALEAGAEDFIADDEGFHIITSPIDLIHIKEAVEQLGFQCDEAIIEMIPKSFIECDSETKASNLALIEWLDGIDDVDMVFHNMKVQEE